MSRFAALVLMGCFVMPVMADGPVCQRKSAEIERKIEYAKKADNRNQILELESALSRVKANCTDAALIADKKRSIAGQQEIIAEIREGVQKEQSNGQYEKVKKLKRKLLRELEELEVLRGELSDIEN
ncbi:MAG: DUF1090 domain-containing protein [Burkholderiaceae bacterium]|nr:DUF1090 domain-containing protein [Burkholderiaceae bacterium]